MIQLISEDVSSDRLGAVARRCGWSLSEGERRIVAAPSFDPAGLTAALAPPLCAAIQLGGEDLPEPGAHFLRHLAAGGIGLWLETGLAHASDPGAILCDALSSLYPAWADRAPGMAGAVHEMVANALIHGNLEVDSPREGTGGFLAYCEEMEKALSDPLRRARRIEMSAAVIDDALEVAIRDQGKGYSPPLPAEGEVECPRRHGIAIASSEAQLSILEGGRCTLLRFADHGP